MLGTTLANWFPSGSPYIGHVNVVAHSMGGLVVRSYMTGLAAVPYRGEFGRLAMAGTPNFGLNLANAAFLCARGTQEFDLKLGSDLIWQVNALWQTSPPIGGSTKSAICQDPPPSVLNSTFWMPRLPAKAMPPML